MNVTLHAISGIPLIRPGDDLGEVICAAAVNEHYQFEDRDIAVIASKIVSKSEGQIVGTENIRPSQQTAEIAKHIGMNPHNLEVILSETKKLLVARPDLLLTVHRIGFICTKAGVDSSNIGPGPKGKEVVLLPKDPDLSARRIRWTIQTITGKEVVTIVCDTFGRADRQGSVGMAIGISGIAANYTQGHMDLFSKQRSPSVSQVDEIAAAASLVMGQTNEARPVVVVRGVEYQPSETDTILDVLQPYSKYLKDVLDIAAQIKKLNNKKL